MEPMVFLSGVFGSSKLTFGSNPVYSFFFSLSNTYTCSSPAYILEEKLQSVQIPSCSYVITFHVFGDLSDDRYLS
jgi:hypothetical protein